RRARGPPCPDARHPSRCRPADRAGPADIQGAAGCRRHASPHRRPALPGRAAAGPRAPLTRAERRPAGSQKLPASGSHIALDTSGSAFESRYDPVVGWLREMIAAAALSLLATAAGSSALEAAPVRVRAPEGPAHGFLVLLGTNFDPLADGDWWQIVNGDRLEVHLRFQFTDVSLAHETFELQQR